MLKTIIKMTTFQKGTLIVACVVVLGMILYPQYKEGRINRGYASIFKYPTVMKTVPKYDFANEFYNFSEQVRVPEKIYVFASVNYIALSIQVLAVLIISSVLWTLGKARNLKTLLEEYSGFNRVLSIINILWFFGIFFSETLPYLFSTVAPIADHHALFQLIALVTPALTIWALHPHAGFKPRLIVVTQNVLAAYYLYLTAPSIPIEDTVRFFIYSVIYIPESPDRFFIILYILFIDYTGAFNALALLMLTILSMTTKPSSSA